MDMPEYVTLLLKGIGYYVDPRILIQNIQSGCEIKDLKKSLVKMMSNYQLQLSVQKACKVITLRKYFELHQKIIVTQQRGISVTDDFVCCVCHCWIIVRNAHKVSDLVAFNCRHTFHKACLPEEEQCQTCTVCSNVTM